ncbi:hypothetical protein HPHPH11_1529 [Helicobacter pylori Hp H-11]|nr:hypothetical protein HPHPH11_1529 [Helicobacter pylori Hp H-11]
MLLASSLIVGYKNTKKDFSLKSPKKTKSSKTKSSKTKNLKQRVQKKRVQKRNPLKNPQKKRV